jgi:ribonuclease D
VIAVTVPEPPEPPAQASDAPAPVPLTEPRDGIPAPLTTVGELEAAVAALADTSGPLAVDAERVGAGHRGVE